MQLSLSLIGWIYTLASVAALAGGVVTTIAWRRSSEQARALAHRNWLIDIITFGLWTVGLVAGVGFLQRRPWSLEILEFFCYGLIVLMVMSIASRFRDMKRQTHDHKINWLGALGGIMLVSVPVVVLCYATIATVHSDATRAAFGLQ